MLPTKLQTRPRNLDSAWFIIKNNGRDHQRQHSKTHLLLGHNSKTEAIITALTLLCVCVCHQCTCVFACFEICVRSLRKERNFSINKMKHVFARRPFKTSVGINIRSPIVHHNQAISILIFFFVFRSCKFCLSHRPFKPAAKITITFIYLLCCTIAALFGSVLRCCVVMECLYIESKRN